MVFEKYEKPLLQIFEHFQEYNDVKITQGLDKTHLQQKGFIQMVQQFNIVPGVMQLTEIQKLYNSLMKDSANPDKGMTFTEFRHFITRISVKNRDYLEKVYEKFKPNDGKEESR